MKWRFEGNENEFIVYQNPFNGMLDILNPVASKIFINCDGKKNIEEIAEIIMKEYKGATKERIISDIVVFLEDLKSRKLAIIAEE